MREEFAYFTLGGVFNTYDKKRKIDKAIKSYIKLLKFLKIIISGNQG